MFFLVSDSFKADKKIKNKKSLGDGRRKKVVGIEWKMKRSRLGGGGE